MQFLLIISGLLVVKVGTAAVFDDPHPSGKDLGTNSSFVKIKETDKLGTSDPVHAIPAVIFVLNHKGEILRCLLAQPNICEVFYKENYFINDLAISDGYLYVASCSSSILRCNLNKKNSCTTFYTAHGEFEVLSLLVAEGYLYAYRDKPSRIIRCDVNQLNSCLPLYEMGLGWVWALAQIDKYIYIGQYNGDVRRCSLRKEDSCKTLKTEIDDTIWSIASTESNFYALTSVGKLWDCSLKFDGTIEGCRHVSSYFELMGDIKIFQNQLYIVEGKGIHICDLSNITNCKSDNAEFYFPRIAIAYETYSVQERYSNEQETCPPLVKYYTSHERDWFEVRVKNGRLYNSRGFIVDTTFADEGHSGPAAIFAMSPDGRLLLSNVHSSQFIRTSSFFAGNPVAGAGEMTVIDGVIMKIAACDEHYLADADLNKQVIQSLRMQGYTDPIESQTCGEDHENQGIESNNIL